MRAVHEQMKRIIILSDDKPTIDCINGVVVEAGGQLEVMRSDHQLLQRMQELEHVPPAAIFVDLGGPWKGERLVEWLRLSSWTHPFRVVAIGEENATVQAYRGAWGAGAVLVKPLQEAAVQQAIQQLDLQRKKQQRARRHASRKLVAAIAESKKLNKERQALAGQIDLLMAELKDKKIPFRKARGKVHSQMSAEEAKQEAAS